MDHRIKQEKFKKQFSNIQNTKKLKNQPITSNHIIKKRKPLQIYKKKNNIYVNNKTNFKVYLRLCKKYLELESKEVVIYGLGAAINRACKLALTLQEVHHDNLKLEIKTSSINLTDDLEPKNDDADYKVNERFTSAICIHLIHIALRSLRFQN